MSDFEKNIDKIREYFEEHKAERYPFKNKRLSEKEEYVKALYFRMLCTLARYTGDANEMQVLYIRRLIAGAHAESKFEDYMKMALDLETKDIDDFVSVFREDALKYYFCIDGAILLSVMQEAEKNYALLAELIEMLGVTNKELQYLTTVAKATILQSSAVFDEARAYITESTESLPLYQYVQAFYAGAITNTPALLHIYSCDKSNVDLSKYSPFKAQKVILENITANVTTDIVFQGCQEVVLKNCTLLGDKTPLTLTSVAKITLENCKIYDFSNHFMVLNGSNELVFHHNHIRSCGYTEPNKQQNAYGGVIYATGNTIQTIVLENNIIQDCYIAKKEYSSGYCSRYIFINISHTLKQLRVVNNTFTGGRCINNYSNTEAYFYGSASKVVKERNVCQGAVTRIFEQYQN